MISFLTALGFHIYVMSMAKTTAQHINRPYLYFISNFQRIRSAETNKFLQLIFTHPRNFDMHGRDVTQFYLQYAYAIYIH